MAIILTKTWNQYAFPDEYPAKEEVWAEESERRRDEVRRDIYLELSGSGLKINRYTSKNRDDAAERAAKVRRFDNMMLAAAAAAYQANYNNPVTLSIGGEEYEFTQGQLHEIATEYRDNVRRQVEEARARGANADALRLLTRKQNGADEFYARTDNPGLRKVTEEDRQAITGIIADNPDLQEFVRSRARVLAGPATSNVPSVDVGDGLNRDSITRSGLANMSRGTPAASFAALMDDPEDQFAAASVGQPFARATENAPPSQLPEPDTPSRDPLKQNTGLDL